MLAPLENAATEFAPEFIMNSIAVVLVDYNTQAPPRQRPMTQTLYSIHGGYMSQYGGRPAAVRGLTGTQKSRHIEAVRK